MAEYNYYKILGVPANASTEEIRRAYRKKAKLFHPDVNDSEKATRMFQVLRDAHDTLCDGNKRRKYDQELEAQHVLQHNQTYQYKQEVKYRRSKYNDTSRPLFFYGNPYKSPVTGELPNWAKFLTYIVAFLFGLGLIVLTTYMFIMQLWPFYMAAMYLLGLILIRDAWLAVKIQKRKGYNPLRFLSKYFKIKF